MTAHPGSLSWKHDPKRGYALFHCVEPRATVVELPQYNRKGHLSWRAWWSTWGDLDLACRRARLSLTKGGRVDSMR